jgi:hypothetical protein
MIDSGHLKRLLLGAALLLLVSAGAATALGAPPSFAGGLALGFLLGATPFASWTWILSRAMGTKRGRVLAVVLLIVKLALYSGALYVCVTRNLVNPVGVLAGMTGVGFILIAGSLWGAPAPAKEAS